MFVMAGGFFAVGVYGVLTGGILFALPPGIVAACFFATGATLMESRRTDDRQEDPE